MNDGVRCNESFWLCDKIYFKWPIFYEIILDQVTDEKNLPTKMHETAQKRLSVYLLCYDVSSRFYFLSSLLVGGKIEERVKMFDYSAQRVG